jgi:hypothetical protein
MHHCETWRRYKCEIWNRPTHESTPHEQSDKNSTQQSLFVFSLLTSAVWFLFLVPRDKQACGQVGVTHKAEFLCYVSFYARTHYRTLSIVEKRVQEIMNFNPRSAENNRGYGDGAEQQEHSPCVPVPGYPLVRPYARTIQSKMQHQAILDRTEALEAKSELIKMNTVIFLVFLLDTINLRRYSESNYKAILVYNTITLRFNRNICREVMYNSCRD